VVVAGARFISLYHDNHKGRVRNILHERMRTLDKALKGQL
jgi:hypothetical protein